MSADEFTIRRGAFVRNGRPVLIYSGEIHYFRLRPSEWADRLATAKRLGLNTIGCYIPWLWHEPQPGRFDFTGRTHPARNLVGFLRLVHQAGLHSFARLGPFCHGELTNEGIPSWLLAAHPEIRLQQRDGSRHPHPGLLSYSHPAYRRFVRRWYAHLLPIIRRFTVERGGPIVLLQCDNEISMLNWVFKAPDYSPHVTAAFQRFLARRHRSLERLNAAYGTRFAAFDAVTQPDGRPDVEGWPRCADWARFYREYHADYFGWLAGQVRRAAIRLPLIANVPQCYDYNVFGRALPGLMTSSMFREVARTDPRVLFGGAYQLRHVTFENFHDLILMNEACRLIGRPANPALCVELQTGALFDRPRLATSDVALTLALCFGGGLQGINGYMLAAGESPPGVGARGRYHEWQAAIAGDGRLRPHARALEQAAGWVTMGGEALASSVPLANRAAFGWYAPYYMTEYLSGPTVSQLEERRDAQFFDGLARLLILAGFRMPFVDLERSTLQELRRYPVIVALSLERMAWSVQQRLLDYARSGGRLVLSPLVPDQDWTGEPAGLLRSALGIKRMKAEPGSVVTVDGEETFTEGHQWAFEVAGAELLGRTHSGRPCAWTKSLGRGTVMVLGFGLLHRFDYQVGLLRRLMQRVGLHPCVEAEPWDVPVLVRVSPRRSSPASRTMFVFACNPHEEIRHVKIHLRIDGRLSEVAEGRSILLPPRSCRMLPVNHRLPGGTVVRSSTCEIGRFDINFASRNLFKDKTPAEATGAGQGCPGPARGQRGRRAKLVALEYNTPPMGGVLYADASALLALEPGEVAHLRLCLARGQAVQGPGVQSYPLDGRREVDVTVRPGQAELPKLVFLNVLKTLDSP
ncbi:MAG: beta-galactosidase [Candidatus Omnitrophica bacterium]|nr:beta-galactosidase [Candidatus Omnitrophota bacterium]